MTLFARERGERWTGWAQITQRSVPIRKRNQESQLLTI